MPASTYYPPTNDGRAAWWQNIADNASPVLNGLGFQPPEVAAIIADAKWAVYSYIGVRSLFDEFTKALMAYADLILDGPNGSALPAMPTVPGFPPAPQPAILCGIEKRRELWVATAKMKSGYTPAAGAMLGIETPADPFDPATYVAELFALSSPAAATVAGKFRKARGNIDGINLYGRKSGTSGWVMLGRFNATPFSALVPLSGANPEDWEFQARAVKRDVEIGLPSMIIPQMIRA